MALTREEEIELLELEIAIEEEQQASGMSGAGGSWEAPPVVTAGHTYFPHINGRPIDARQQAPMFKGLAGAVVDSGLEGGGASLGHAAGAATGPFAPVAIPALGAVGAGIGNALGQGRRMWRGEQEDFSMGQLAAASAMGTVPGASLAKAPVQAVAKKAVRYGAENVGAKAIETGIDEGRLPTAKEAMLAATVAAAAAPASKFISAKSPKESFNSVRDSRFQELRPEGVVVPPHAMGRGSDLLSSLGGKQALEADAALRNQPTMNRLNREEIDLQGAKPLKLEEIKAEKARAGSVYQAVQDIGDSAKVRLAAIEKQLGAPGGMDYEVRKAAKQQEIDELSVLAGADANAYKRAQDEVRDIHQQLAMGTSQDARDRLVQAEARVAQIKAGIDAAVTAAGKPKLAAAFDEARQKYAKIIDIESATTEASGFIDARKLGAIHEASPERLTGNLRKTAQFASAFKDEARDANIVSAPGVNKMSANQAIQSAGRGTMGGMIAAAAGVAGKPVRKFLLSDLMQDYMAKPKEVGPSMRAALVKQMMASQGRK